MFDECQRIRDDEVEPLVRRTRLRLMLLAGDGDPERQARDCVSGLLLEHGAVADLAALVDTTLLLRQALPSRVDPTLVAEARRAVHRLGNTAAKAQLLSDETDATWHPLHPAV